MLYGCAALLGVEFLEGLLGLRGRPLLLSLSAILVMATVSMFVLAIVLYNNYLLFYQTCGVFCSGRVTGNMESLERARKGTADPSFARSTICPGFMPELIGR